MALALKDRVKETTIVVGTGAATLLGSSIGFQPFSVVGNGNTTYYCISDQFGSNWEVGIGTYSSSGNTLARTTVLASSNAGALVVFTTGVKDVFVTYPSEKGVWYDASGNVLFTGTTTAANLAYTGTLTGGTGVIAIGTNQIYKDASGNVGIGTSSPQALLDLGGGTLGKGISWNSSSTSSYGNIYTSYTNAQLVIAQGLKGSTTVAGGFQSANSATWAKSAIMLDYGVISFYSNPPDTVTYGTAYTPSERMRIDSSGNVGINTTVTTKGKLCIQATPSSQWGIDLAPVSGGANYVTIANNGTYSMPVNTSGMIILYEEAGFCCGLLFAHYGRTSVVWQDPVSSNISNASGTAGKINFYYNGAAHYVFENLSGSSRTLIISSFKARNAA